MAWLLDTNVVSEFYKGEKGSARVRAGYATLGTGDLFLSVLVLGEIRRGVELRRLKDVAAAESLERWVLRLEESYGDKILPLTSSICDLWGRLSPQRMLAPIDGLLAATALHHGLTLATRNTRDVQRSGVDCFNPFGD